MKTTLLYLKPQHQAPHVVGQILSDFQVIQEFYNQLLPHYSKMELWEKKEYQNVYSQSFKNLQANREYLIDNAADFAPILAEYDTDVQEFLLLTAPKPETVAIEAFRLLNPIPSDEWLVNVFSNGTDKCCGIGHWVRLKSSNPANYLRRNCIDSTENDSQLRYESVLFFRENGYPSITIDIASVNNRKTGKYQQETPKGRVIACLIDMIEAGF